MLQFFWMAILCLLDADNSSCVVIFYLYAFHALLLVDICACKEMRICMWAHFPSHGYLSFVGLVQEALETGVEFGSHPVCDQCHQEAFLLYGTLF